MTDKIAAVILFLVGIINLLPAVVFFDAGKTVRLYGVAVEGESMLILMRHRAVLLSLVGLALVTAVFKPDFRMFAVAAALISKFAFIFLAFSAPDFSPEIKQVALIDVGAIVLLLAVLGIQFYSK